MTSDAASVLQAGGLVPVAAAVPADLPTDTVDAVRFVHPALGERVVVRLIPDAIAEGVETEMGLLGFLLQGKDDDIARMKRRSPGFPGWALVNDPERARFALDVMKDFKKEAKRIASKPGHARDGFQAIADRLGRSVPHFLPSFWEEVGRAFVDAGNLSFAASAFDKARTAEREHGLAVDEEARAEVFLEFALAGALTVKSLQSYAKELERVLGAEKAYDRFYALAVKRTLGGLAPWASFAKDLRGLAKAAKRKQDAEDERVLEDVLDGSGVVRAPADFWRTYEPALQRLATRVPRVKGRLLDLFPKPASGGDEFEVEWLELLDRLGVIDGLAKADPSFAPSGGAAAWFGKAVAYLEDAKPRLLPLLRRLSKRLIAEGQPVKLCDADDWWPQIDVDLLDLCLELGVPVASPPEDGTFDLDDWAKGETGDDGEVHPRDPVFVAKDERFRAMLDKAVDAAVGDEDFERQARGKAALVAARRRWLEERIATVDRDGVPALVEAVDTLAEKTTAATFAEFGDLYPKLLACRPAEALRTTLATAIPDELAWPAYEEVVAELKAGLKKDEELAISGAFPWLFVSDGARRVVVIGPAADGRIGRVLEHDLKLPKNASLRGLSYVDGQLLVVTSGWIDGEWKTAGYWSGAPKETFDLEQADHRLQGAERVSVALPGGGATEGGRLVRAGDTTAPGTAHVLYDGAGVWVVDDDAETVRPLDPRDGKRGAPSLPAFLQGWADEARPLAPMQCELHPVPAVAHATSPLGVRDGLGGWRVRGPEDGPKDVEGIDGRRFGALHDGGLCLMLVTWPGDDVPVPVDTYYVTWRTNGLRLWTRDGRCAVAQVDDTYAAKLLPAPPREWWHFLVPRDAAGSRALRAVTTAQAERLLAGEDVRAVLPAVTDPGFAEGVAKVVAVAKAAADGLAQVIADHDPARAGTTEPPPSEAGDDVDDDDVFEVLKAVLPRQWSASERLTASIRSSSALLDSGRTSDGLVQSDIRWFELLGRERGLAFLAVAPAVDDDAREPMLKVLEHLAASRFAEKLDDLRVVDLQFDTRENDFLVLQNDDDDDDASVAEAFGHADGDHVWHAVTISGWSDPVTVLALERAGADGFRVPQGGVVKKERRLGPPAGREWLRRFVAEARARGPIPVDDDILDGIGARTGLTRPEAALLWAGLPNLMTWGNDFLGKPLREKLGLKVAEAKTARDSLRGMPPDARLALFAATVPDDPAALWTPLGAGPDDETSPVARFSAAYVARFGRKPTIPDDLVTEASRALAVEIPVKDALEMAAAPEGSPWMAASDVPYTMDLYGNPVPDRGASGDEEEDDEAPRFSDKVVETVVRLIPWLAAALPVGDPIRAGLPRLHALALERAKDEGFLTRVGGATMTGVETAGQFLDTIGGERWLPKDADDEQDDEDAPVAGRRKGAILAHRWGYTLYVCLRPGSIDDHARDVVERFLKFDVAGSAYASLRRLHDDGMRALVARIADTPLPAGAWEQDPSKSAPDVVAKVRKKLGLSEDAAILYLQILALHAPTKKATLEWNGWKSARYDAAAAELVAKELVVEAKRARAGREHFLPGGWIERKSKDLPLEEWKLPLYGGGRDDDGDVTFPLDLVLPLEPVHATFAKAWARVEAGDVPRFQKVRS